MLYLQSLFVWCGVPRGGAGGGVGGGAGGGAASRKRVPGGTARLFLANRLFFPSIARKKVDFVMNPSKKGYSS